MSDVSQSIGCFCYVFSFIFLYIFFLPLFFVTLASCVAELTVALPPALNRSYVRLNVDLIIRHNLQRLRKVNVFRSKCVCVCVSCFFVFVKPTVKAYGQCNNQRVLLPGFIINQKI